ncbi:MAG TPA: RNA polymerase sigma factor [Thermoanaerobaculia bacterium]|jgi:RNA polymerase sigma-70 factor (ECF subfamily)
MTDSETIERFRALFDEHAGTVYRFLFCLTGSADAADELAQETFVRAFQSFASFEARSAPSTWLCGIARNVALHHFRSERQRGRVFDRDAALERAGGQGPERDLLSRELRDAIGAALLELDEEKRTAFTLKIVQQKSYEEIAAITGAAIAKLKTDVHRARMQMRALLWRFREET